MPFGCEAVGLYAYADAMIAARKGSPMPFGCEAVGLNMKNSLIVTLIIGLQCLSAVRLLACR